MARAVKPIDVDGVPELVRLAREVRESGEPHVLREGGEDLALLTPVAPTRTYPWREKTEADYEAFRSAAGGWKDVDTDKIIEDIYADRRMSDHPAVDL